MLTKSKDHNPNYLCSILKLEHLRKHENADRLQIASCYSNNVITGMNTKKGDLMVYFPLESTISTEFLSYTNSLDNAEMNHDKTVKGFFSYKQRRVKALKLRGEKSEGYIVPVSQLEAFSKDVLGKKAVFDESHVGQDFDEINGHMLCQKYVIFVNTPNPNKKKTKGSLKKYESKLVDNQFRLHYDTEQLKRNMFKISPTDLISITDKLHGTSFVVSNVLIKKKSNIFNKIAKLIGFDIKDTEYGMLYSSRCVIKNQNYLDPKDNGGFYKEDLWKLVADRLYPLMKEGISVYGEIVGYTPSGGWIQRDFDYGMNQGNYDFYIYRVTYTSATGDVYEFSHNQVKEWCKKHDVKMVPEFYYGYAKDLWNIRVDGQDDWHDMFLQMAINTYLEKDCTICKNKVPSEGVVLRKDNVHDYEAFKLKSFRFLEKESKDLDTGVVDIESAQAIVEDTEETL